MIILTNNALCNWVVKCQHNISYFFLSYCGSGNDLLNPVLESTSEYIWTQEHSNEFLEINLETLINFQEWNEAISLMDIPKYKSYY